MAAAPTHDGDHWDTRSPVDYKRIAVAAAVSLGILLGTAVGYTFYWSSLDAYLANKGEEKETALELIAAFVAEYSHVRRQFEDGEPPVPATFRAGALARFNTSREASRKVKIQWVGVPGREIRVAPKDPGLARILSDYANQPDPRPLSNLVEQGSETLLRSVFPSIATEESCVSCHNRMQQVSPPWKLGDVMGAFAVDSPATEFLSVAKIKAFGLSVGVFLFVTICLIVLYLVMSRHRFAALTIEKHAHDRLMEAVREMAHGFAIFGDDGTIILRNAAYRPVEPEATDLPSREVDTDDGRILRIDHVAAPSGRTVEVQTDLTELKHRERELRATHDQLVVANRAKSEFLARMSHELRTPMNAILGFAEVLRDDYLKEQISTRYRDYAKGIFESGSMLLSLINDVLDLSKIEAGKLVLNETSFDLHELAESVCALFRDQAARAGVELKIRTGVRPGMIRADERAMRQVLNNLISNAIKFTDVAGSVTVETGAAEDGSFVVSVADTGVGMSADQVEVALLPFEQAHSASRFGHQGTGLGLPLAKNLIELHSGSLEILSRPRVGTTVRVQLPQRLARKPEPAALALA